MALLERQRLQGVGTPARGSIGGSGAAGASAVPEFRTPPLHRAAHQSQAATAPPWDRAQRPDGADYVSGNAGHVQLDVEGSHAASARGELIPSFGGEAAVCFSVRRKMPSFSAVDVAISCVTCMPACLRPPVMPIMF